MKRINFNIDEKLDEKFSIKCIKNKKTKTEVLTEFIEKYSR